MYKHVVLWVAKTTNSPVANESFFQMALQYGYMSSFSAGYYKITLICMILLYNTAVVQKFSKSKQCSDIYIIIKYVHSVYFLFSVC